MQLENQEKMYDNILIDGTNLFFRSVYFGLKKDLSTKVIVETFFEIIELVKTKFNHTSSIYFFYDDSKILFRKQLDSSYKRNRDKNKLPTNIFYCLSLTKEILSVKDNNYFIIQNSGYEADDFVKPLLKSFGDSKNLLISNDLDWCRSINEKTNWYNWNELFDEKLFVEKYTFYPNNEAIKLYKSLKGDKSNNIPVGVLDLCNEVIFGICRRAIDYKSFQDFENDLSWIEKSEKNKILHSFERLTLNYELTNFIPLQKNISEYITNCYENKFQMKILLESLGLEIKLSKEDIENEFFDLL